MTLSINLKRKTELSLEREINRVMEQNPSKKNGINVSVIGADIK